MRNVMLVMALAMAGVSGCVATQPVVVVTSGEVEARRAVDFAHARWQGGDMVGALAAFERVIALPAFADLPTQVRYAVLELTGEIALGQGDQPRAHALFSQASVFDIAEPDIWHLRLSAAYDLKDTQDSAICIATIARKWPDTLDRINHRAILRVANEAIKPGVVSPSSVEMLDALFQAEWTAVNQRQPDHLWLELASALLSKDHVDAAARVAARIESADTALRMRADRHFDRISQRGTAFDLEQMSAKELAQVQAFSRDHPNLLEPIVRQQSLLLASRQFEQALALSDAVIARVRDPDSEAGFDDFTDEYPWLLDNRALALKYLARWDEALTQRRRAARYPEDGGLNVSHAINLGQFYAQMGRGDDALDAVAEIGPPSAFGRMQMELLKVMVATQRDDDAARVQHVDFMREHRADAPSAYQWALLETGDMEAGAAWLIERLQDRRWRGDALVDMQTYPAVPMMPRQAIRLARWGELLARADVRAALDRVGRIEKIPLLLS